MSILCLVWRKTVGIESGRLDPQFFVPVQAPCRDSDRRGLWDLVRPNCRVFTRLTRDSRRRRRKPHRLLYDLSRKGELLNLRPADVASPRDSQDFLAYSRLRYLIFGEQP